MQLLPSGVSSTAVQMSPIHKLTDVEMLEILRWAMMRESPLSINNCIRTAKALERARVAEPSLAKYRTILTESDPSQLLHLRDWRVAGSVSKDFRRLGKEAFFSSKIFAMDVSIARNIQKCDLERLSTEDQRTASKHIRAIVLVENIHPSPFIRLPNLVAGFPRLERLDLLFTKEKILHDADLVAAAEARMQAPSHLIDILRSIGVPTERLVIGVMVRDPVSTRFSYEKRLEDNVYPTLKVWANVKAQREQGTQTRAEGLTPDSTNTA